MTVRKLEKPLHKEVNYTLQHKGEEQDEDQLRQLMLGEVDQFVMPASAEAFDILAFVQACIRDLLWNQAAKQDV